MKRCVCLVLAVCMCVGMLCAAPETVVIQGRLMDSDDNALSGDRAWRVQYYNAETGGSPLGTAQTGTVSVSDSGLFSISLTPPVAVVAAAGDVWYELGVDSASTPDGAVDAADIFSSRVRVESVHFSQHAANSDSLGGVAASAYSTDAERDSAIATATGGLVTDPAAPGTPYGLCLTVSPRAYPWKRLVWYMDSAAGVANFVVYESNAPITEANKASARKRYGTTTELELPVYANSGLRYFRVAAANFTGEEGDLSNEYVLDATSRAIFTSDLETVGIYELWSMSIGSEEEPVRVNGPFYSFSDLGEYKISPDGRRLIYSADAETDDAFELYAANTDGSGDVVKLSGDLITGFSGISLRYFGITPDGQWAVFLAGSYIDNNYEVYASRMDGSTGPILLSEDTGDPTLGVERHVYLRFSPDSRLVAFYGDMETDGLENVYVVPVDGSGAPLKITPDLVSGQILLSGFFSLDCQEYYFTSSLHGEMGVFSVPVSGSLAYTQLSPDVVSGGGAYLSQLTPEGDRLLIEGDIEVDGKNEIFVIPAKGGAALKLNDEMVAGGEVETVPDVNPRGHTFTYRADQDTDGVIELYEVSLSGGGMSRKLNASLVVNGDVNSHRVSPDGKYVVYLADQNTNGRNELFVVDLDGDSTPVRVNPALDADENVLNYAFSPDGQYIVYHADQDIDNVWELYYAPARGGGVARKMHPDLSGDKDVYPFKITPLGYDPMEP